MEQIKLLDFEAPFAEVEGKIRELGGFASDGTVDFSAEIARLQNTSRELMEKVYAGLQPWQVTQVARHPQRPYFLDYVKYLCEDFVELHGDRQFGDDKPIITGFGNLNGHEVVLIGQQKGRNTKENILRNFGMPRPEGYRKALRVMQLAEKFNKPIITFIDTPGAYPGLDAEERGQGEAIARNLREMSMLKVPIIVCVVGEGGSGGALGIGVGDRILMMQHSIYSVISPEGCASILWRDATKASTAAEALKMTAKDLLANGVIDEIIPEPPGGAHRDPQAAAASLRVAILRHLGELQKMPVQKLPDKRYEKFRKMGPVREG